MHGRIKEKSSIGESYVAVDEVNPRTVLGYYTLAMASIRRDALPMKYIRGLPPYDLPMTLLARLAVDLRFAGRGLGHALISEAFRISVRVADEVGCRCMIMMHIVIGPVGTPDTDLLLLRALGKAGHNGCSLIADHPGGPEALRCKGRDHPTHQGLVALKRRGLV